MKVFHSIFLVAVCFSVCVGCTRPRDTGTNPGDIAPDFKLASLGSREYSLSEFRGKVILLNFWASWCGPCVAEMPALQRLHDQLKDQGFTVIAVGIEDEPAALEEFRQKFGLSFPVLVDSAGVTKRSYSTTGVPESFFIDRAGKLILFPDPADKMPVVRVVGPREWDSPNVVARVKTLLQKTN